MTSVPRGALKTSAAQNRQSRLGWTHTSGSGAGEKRCDSAEWTRFTWYWRKMRWAVARVRVDHAMDEYTVINLFIVVPSSKEVPMDTGRVEERLA